MRQSQFMLVLPVFINGIFSLSRMSQKNNRLCGVTDTASSDPYWVMPLSNLLLLHVGMHGDLPLAKRIWQWWHYSHSLDYLRHQKEILLWTLKNELLPMEKATGTLARNTGQPLGVEGLHLPEARNWTLLMTRKLQKGNCWLLNCSLWDPEQRPQMSCACTPDPWHCEVSNECWFRPLSLWPFVFSNQNWYMWLPQL